MCARTALLALPQMHCDILCAIDIRHSVTPLPPTWNLTHLALAYCSGPILQLIVVHLTSHLTSSHTSTPLTSTSPRHLAPIPQVSAHELASVEAAPGAVLDADDEAFAAHAAVGALMNGGGGGAEGGAGGRGGGDNDADDDNGDEPFDDDLYG